jgi:hypothetical protein
MEYIEAIGGTTLRTVSRSLKKQPYLWNRSIARGVVASVVFCFIFNDIRAELEGID